MINMNLTFLNQFPISFLCFAIFFSFNTQIDAQDDSEKYPLHYIFPTFNKGLVVMKGGNTKQSVLNYNTITQEMIFEQYGKRLALDKLETIDTVIIQDRKFIPKGKVFYELAILAPISLFIEHKSDITSEGKSIGYGTKKQTTSSTSFSKLIAANGLYSLKLPDDYYITNTSINWIQKNESMIKFVTKRQFLKIFPEP